MSVVSEAVSPIAKTSSIFGHRAVIKRPRGGSSCWQLRTGRRGRRGHRSVMTAISFFGTRNIVEGTARSSIQATVEVTRHSGRVPDLVSLASRIREADRKPRRGNWAPHHPPGE